MDNAHLVRMGQTAGGLQHVIHGLFHRQRFAALDRHGQIVAFHVFQNQKAGPLVFAGVKGGDDVRMRHPRHGFDFAMEPFGRRLVLQHGRGHHFEGDGRVIRRCRARNTIPFAPCPISSSTR